MNDAPPSARVARLDQVEAIPVAGGLYVPLRRTLGARAFGINAYLAPNAGDQLIEKHDETGSGAGGHEEAYIIVSGRALFTVAGEEIDAPAGTVVFVPDVATTRSAVALEAGTTAIVVGGPADRPLPVSPFECWFVAEAPYREGDYAAAIEIAEAGLEEWPDYPVIHYQLACYHALAGNPRDALDHLGSGHRRGRQARRRREGGRRFRFDARRAALRGSPRRGAVAGAGVRRLAGRRMPPRV